MSGTLICGKTTSNSVVPVLVNTDGSLEMTAEISTAGLATEAKQDDMITDLSQIATNTSRLAPQLTRTEAIPVQIMVGSGGANYDALRANGQDLMVMIDDMNPDVAVNSGLSTSTKQDDMITHLADIDNQTNSILTYQVQINQTQTNGNQVVKCMGNYGGTNVQLKVDANGVLETSGGGGGGGDATAANQTLQLAEETLTANSTSSLDSKITQGNDSQIPNTELGLQQVLCYGRDNAGNLDALLTDASGHLEVVMDDFVKGQDTMANSLPVVIASDQSAVATSSAQLPASLGQKANASSISICRSTTAGAFDLSARTTIATAGTSTKLLCDSDGKLAVNSVPADEVTISQVNQAITNGNTFTSTGVDMRGYERISFFGNSTNNADEIYILVSADDITYYTNGGFVTKDFTTGDFSFDGTLGARYFKLRQASTDFNANFTITCISSKK
jgi:hypothetical protein